jgi:hypothetical protein
MKARKSKRTWFGVVGGSPSKGIPPISLSNVILEKLDKKIEELLKEVVGEPFDVCVDCGRGTLSVDVKKNFVQCFFFLCEM